MNDTATPPAPPQRKCAIEEVFDASFIELLQLVPANPYVRALILKLTGKMPPVECELFEPLKDWIEFNCVKRLRKTAGRLAGGIAVSVDFTETEYGRARYSVECSGSSLFHVGGDDLLGIIRETIADGGGLDEVVEVIAGRIDDDAWNQCNPDMESYGDYDYSDHETTDSDHGATDCSKDEIRTAVRRFIRENHPELAGEL